MIVKAVARGDLAHARLPSFRRRVDSALRAVKEAARRGKIGCSFSGGKDSLVTMSLVRDIIPDAPAALYDSGAEYCWVYELAEYYGVVVIKPEMSLLEMCRAGGYWGYNGPALVDAQAEYDFFAFLVGEPSRRFVNEHDLAVVALGLRAEESGGRRMNAYKRGNLYYLDPQEVWHLCPLADWTHDDVWAFIASRGLRYNQAYDRMAQLGIPRERWRVSALLGMCGAATLGRYAYLRQIDPGLFHRLAAEFPKICNFT